VKEASLLSEAFWKLFDFNLESVLTARAFDGVLSRFARQAKGGFTLRAGTENVGGRIYRKGGLATTENFGFEAQEGHVFLTALDDIAR